MDMNRRSFLKTSMVAAAGLVIAPSNEKQNHDKEFTLML